MSSLRKKILLSSLILCLIVFAAFQVHKSSTASDLPIHQTPLAAHASSSAYTPGEPIRLAIPSIALDAKIENLGLTKEGGALAVPKNFVDAGWYQDGPKPGMPGSAVIDGHYNGKHVPEGVFFKLGNLSIGDSVFIIDSNNQRLEFLVTKVKTFAYTDSTEEVFQDSTESHLNLITCAGDWLPSEHLFDKRTVVFTRLVQPVL